MKTSNNNSPVYINMTKAANLLGYKSAVVIRNLIKEGLLTKYSFPDSSRAMVDENEVISLIQPVKPSQKTITS